LRKHLSLKQIGSSLGVAETYAGQAFDPALEKVAKVVLDYGELAMLLLLERVQELRHEREQQRFEQELPERIVRQAGGRRC
jgi:DNA-binding LacI/PurR family transcriptional regulator